MWTFVVSSGCADVGIIMSVSHSLRSSEKKLAAQHNYIYIIVKSHIFFFPHTHATRETISSTSTLLQPRRVHPPCVLMWGHILTQLRIAPHIFAFVFHHSTTTTDDATEQFRTRWWMKVQHTFANSSFTKSIKFSKRQFLFFFFFNLSRDDNKKIWQMEPGPIQRRYNTLWSILTNYYFVQFLLLFKKTPTRECQPLSHMHSYTRIIVLSCVRVRNRIFRYKKRVIIESAVKRETYTHSTRIVSLY